jgi:hypothetical protein
MRKNLLRLKQVLLAAVILSASLLGMVSANAENSTIPETILPGSLASSAKFYPGYCHQPGSGVVLPVQNGEIDNCSADNDEMRRNHMELLIDKRDMTMHQGVRTEDFSLKECVACHASKDESGKFIPINEEGQFCQSCHVRVAAKLDCFECHRTTPARDQEF